MKKYLVFVVSILVVLAAAFLLARPALENRRQLKVIAGAFDNASEQLKYLIDECEEGDTVRIPMSIKPDGSVKFVPTTSWVSGFLPGTLWYMYEYTGDEYWAEHARRHTEILDKIQYNTQSHDVGFMIYCSYGNGLRLKGTKEYESVIVNAAKSLCTRFQSGAGIIKSWDWGGPRGWTCPVIIDNMMNLELLFRASEISKDSTYFKVAVSHADKTLANHFRPDYSTWHMVDYNPETGEVIQKKTVQGYSDDSAWSRGQSWGLYGYTMAYRFTGFQRYLDQAVHIADFLIHHPNLPEDGVPYWDYNAPDIPDAPRDAAAAAVMASGLYELYSFTGDKRYLSQADKTVTSLSSPAYTAAPGTNHGFILMHSVTNMNDGTDIDKPLNYTDYYYLEALLRRRKLR